MLGFQVWVKQVPRQEGIPKRDTVSSSMYPFSHSQIKASKKTQKALQLCASSLLESQCEILIMDWLLHLPFFAARPMVFLRGFPFQICRDWAAIVHNLTLVSFVGFFVILYFCGLLMEDMLSSYFCNHLLLMSFFFLPKNAEFPWLQPEIQYHIIIPLLTPISLSGVRKNLVAHDHPWKLDPYHFYQIIFLF